MKSNKLTNQAINNMIGKHVKDIRLSHKKSRNQMGKAININPRTLEENEKGKYKFTLERLFFIADSFGICVTELIPAKLKGRINKNNKTNSDKNI